MSEKTSSEKSLYKAVRTSTVSVRVLPEGPATPGSSDSNSVPVVSLQGFPLQYSTVQYTILTLYLRRNTYSLPQKHVTITDVMGYVTSKFNPNIHYLLV